jgi:hypothetical protein
MVPIVYPAGLPCPAMASMQAAERRLLSSLAGARQSRSFSRDRLARQQVEFTFTHEALAVFVDWVKDDLSNAAAWFSADWPMPQGGTGVFRFIGTPSFPVYLHGVGWKVSAVCQVRGRGESPLFIPSNCELSIAAAELAKTESEYVYTTYFTDAPGTIDGIYYNRPDPGSAPNFPISVSWDDLVAPPSVTVFSGRWAGATPGFATFFRHRRVGHRYK